MAKSSHTSVDIKTNNHIDSMNGKAFHSHLPRIYNGMDKTFNSFTGSGGAVECAICGEVLMDNMS